MKKSTKLSLTEKATRALQEAVAAVVEDHRRRGIPLAIWRDGKAVSVPASELESVNEALPDHTRRKAK